MSERRKKRGARSLDEPRWEDWLHRRRQPHTLACVLSRECPHRLYDIRRCVICGRYLRSDRTLVDTCGDACLERLVAEQRNGRAT